jgi:ParB/RepB/Spo0J family partition protein
VVRPSDKDGIFWVVAGERRYRSLESLAWDKGVPCIVRTDLADDDDRALAVAVAENSEDGRFNLNYIEIGRVVSRLTDSGWTVGRVSKETGLHTQKVRRAMSLMDAPTELQTKVESNEVSMRTALECLKLDDKTRKAVIAELGPTTTEGDIKKIRKELDSNTTEKVTKTPHRPVTAWRGSREKQKQVQKMCYFLSQAHDDSEQMGTGDYHEIRGSVAYSLWDRGDLSNPILPSIHPEDESNPKKATKQNEAFMSIVRAEADRYDNTDATKD